jgi:hypothetical protein
MSYLKQKRDANHSQVAEHLRRVGCDVLEVLKPLDLLVSRKGEVCFVEVKIPGSAAKFTRVQLEFIAYRRFPVIIATSGDEASQKMRDRAYLSQRQRDKLAALLAFETKEYFTPAEVGKALEV